MKKFLFFDAPLSDAASSLVLLLLRLFIGTLMLLHGWAKIENFEQLSATFPDPIGFGSRFALLLSILAEVGCSLMIIFGIFTRLATLPLIVNMLVAAFVAHGSDPFQAKEPAVLYLGIYVLLFFLGSGRIAVSHALMNRLARGTRRDSIYS